LGTSNGVCPAPTDAGIRYFIVCGMNATQRKTENRDKYSVKEVKTQLKAKVQFKLRRIL